MKHSSQILPCFSTACILFCLRNVFMLFPRFSEHSFDDCTNAINGIVFGMEKHWFVYRSKTAFCMPFRWTSRFIRWTVTQYKFFNRLTPNDPYMGRTAPLTSKRCILCTYSTKISTEYFKHALYSPFFSLQNAVYFIMLTCLVLYYSHFTYSVCWN